MLIVGVLVFVSKKKRVLVVGFAALVAAARAAVVPFPYVIPVPALIVRIPAL
jgi:hypothetical protein